MLVTVLEDEVLGVVVLGAYHYGVFAAVVEGVLYRKEEAIRKWSARRRVHYAHLLAAVYRRKVVNVGELLSTARYKRRVSITKKKPSKKRTVTECLI